MKATNPLDDFFKEQPPKDSGEMVRVSWRKANAEKKRLEKLDREIEEYPGTSSGPEMQQKVDEAIQRLERAEKEGTIVDYAMQRLKRAEKKRPTREESSDAAAKQLREDVK